MAEGRLESGVLVLRLDTKPAAEVRFDRWYKEEFRARLLAAPGTRAVRRFTALDAEPNTWLLVDTMNLDALHKAVALGQGRRPRGGLTPPVGVAVVGQGLYRQVFPRYSKPSLSGFAFKKWTYRPPAGADLLMAVAYDAPPEVEEEFNDWYDGEHVPMVLDVPGFLSGRRFRLEAGSADEPTLLSLYDVVNVYAFYSNEFGRSWRRISPWNVRMHAKVKRRYKALYERVP